MKVIISRSGQLTILATFLLAMVPFISPELTRYTPPAPQKRAPSVEPAVSPAPKPALPELAATELAEPEPVVLAEQAVNTVAEVAVAANSEPEQVAAVIEVELPEANWAIQPDYTYPELPQFAEISDVKQKKQAFFDYLAPAVNSLNQRAMAQRNWLQALQAEPSEALLSHVEIQTRWQHLLTEYRMSDDLELSEQAISDLLMRVDAIPMELVLIQAANESAWGTSRFATQGNNLFGQWCFQPGCGLVPASRPAGQTYEVQQFTSVKASVHSYLRNLNTHNSYTELRLLRSGMRATSTPLEAPILAQGLEKYSTRGSEYVAEIVAMMRHNHDFVVAAQRGAEEATRL